MYNQKSARGVYYDISLSDIYVDIDGLRFYFSSVFNKERFINRLIEYNHKCDMRFTNVAKIKIKQNITSLRLYDEIEKRGFLIKNTLNGGIYKCLDEVNLRISLAELLKE